VPLLNNVPSILTASRPLTYTVAAVNERGETEPTQIAGEHPLTLYVDKREIVTLMTLGAAPECLAIGYLRNQRLVESIEDIVAVQVDWEVDAVAVTTRNGIADLDGRMEKRTVTTGCGQGQCSSLMEEIATSSCRTTNLCRSKRSTPCSITCANDTVYKSAGRLTAALYARMGRL
jgi:FdhD protein